MRKTILIALLTALTSPILYLAYRLILYPQIEIEQKVGIIGMSIYIIIAFINMCLKIKR
jgi:hypothetical protein